MKVNLQRIATLLYVLADFVRNPIFKGQGEKVGKVVNTVGFVLVQTQLLDADVDSLTEQIRSANNEGRPELTPEQDKYWQDYHHANKAAIEDYFKKNPMG